MQNGYVKLYAIFKLSVQNTGINLFCFQEFTSEWCRGGATFFLSLNIAFRGLPDQHFAKS